MTLAKSSLQERAAKELQDTIDHVGEVFASRGMGSTFEALALVERTLQRWAPRGSTWVDAWARALRAYRSTDDEELVARMRVHELLPILKAMKFDYENGRLWNFESGIHNRLFQGELAQAEELLSEGYPKAAAVASGVVLEAHLRRLASKNQVEHKNENGKYLVADQINHRLKKAGVYDETDRKLVTAWLGLRDSGAHPDPPSIPGEKVQLMISGISEFIKRSPSA